MENSTQQRGRAVWFPLFLAIAAVIGMFAGYKVRDSVPGRSFFAIDKPDAVEEILTLIGRKYVDSVDIRSLQDSAVQTMLAALDPHSSFIPAKELEQVNDEIRGSFFGIGIEFSIIDDSLHVTNVLQGGPSDKAGLQTGDILIKAGDSVLSGAKRSSDQIIKLLRGPEGSKLILTLLKNGKQKRTELARAPIPIVSVDVAYMIAPQTGYIRLNKFSTTTYREFMIALTGLQKNPMNKLILDLRDNGGGVLDEAVEIADEFIPGDRLITYTQGAHMERREFRCRRDGRFETGKLIVLADEGTASASEVLMGALQDWDRATIIGRKTFGKGLVQEQYDLSDGSAVRLTVARYYTPLGRSIQRSYKKGAKDYYEQAAMRYLHPDSSTTDSSKRFKSPAGKVLFGSDGIAPDMFVRGDTASLSTTVAKIYSRGTLNDFGYNYYKLRRAELNKYKNAEEFIKNFDVTQDAWNQFARIAATDTIDVSGVSLQERHFIEGVLKSAIARQLFRAQGLFEALNENDPMITKALEL